MYNYQVYLCRCTWSPYVFIQGFDISLYADDIQLPSISAQIYAQPMCNYSTIAHNQPPAKFVKYDIPEINIDKIRRDNFPTPTHIYKNNYRYLSSQVCSNPCTLSISLQYSSMNSPVALAAKAGHYNKIIPDQK
jgi:hypothetical protein